MAGVEGEENLVSAKEVVAWYNAEVDAVDRFGLDLRDK